MWRSATGALQLPAAPGHFTGRSAELEWLTGLSERGEPAGAGGTVVICAVDGMAGIGKTALAIHAAHRLAEATGSCLSTCTATPRDIGPLL